MKTFLKLAVAAALTFAFFSCQKESVPEGQNIQAQYEYLDTACEEALTQIEPTDFQRLADLIGSLPEDPSALEIDDDSKENLIALASKLVEIRQLESVIVINFDKINGTFTIQDNTLSYDKKLIDTDRKIVLVDGEKTYTADFTVTTPSSPKEVYLGELEIEEGKDKYKVYLQIPTAFTAKVSDNAGLYMGATVKDIDCSQMPADWSELTPDQINCSFSGTGFINGLGSYRAESSKISIALGKASLEGGALYGRAGKPLATGNGSFKFSTQSGSETGIGLAIDWSSLSFYGNLIDKIAAKNNDKSGIDMYFNPIETKQLSFDPETGDVTFTNGTVVEFEDFFNQKNFPKSYTSATQKVQKFVEIFGAIMFASAQK